MSWKTILTLLALATSASSAWGQTPGGTGAFMPMAPEAAISNGDWRSEVPALNLQADPGESGSTKNPRLAMLYSLVLPGLGELYLGNKNRAAAFFVAEAGIWALNFHFNNQADTRKVRYREYAEAEAGASIRRDDDFYRQLGIYISSDGPRGANETIRRQARAQFPNDRDMQEEYVLENGYFGANSWTWESSAAFQEYGRLRQLTLDSEENAKLTIGMMVANRLISVVDVGLLSRNLTLGDDVAELSWDVNVGPQGPHAEVVLSKGF